MNWIHVMPTWTHKCRYEHKTVLSITDNDSSLRNHDETRPKAIEGDCSLETQGLGKSF